MPPMTPRINPILSRRMVDVSLLDRVVYGGPTMRRMRDALARAHLSTLPAICKAIIGV